MGRKVVECPDCQGSGLFDEEKDCEGCSGSGDVSICEHRWVKRQDHDTVWMEICLDCGMEGRRWDLTSMTQ